MDWWLGQGLVCVKWGTINFLTLSEESVWGGLGRTWENGRRRERELGFLCKMRKDVLKDKLKKEKNVLRKTHNVDFWLPHVSTTYAHIWTCTHKYKKTHIVVINSKHERFLENVIKTAKGRMVFWFPVAIIVHQGLLPWDLKGRF